MKAQQKIILTREQSFILGKVFLKTQLRFKVQHLRDYFYINGFELVEEYNKDELILKPIMQSNFTWLLTMMRNEKLIKRVSRLMHESLIFEDTVRYVEIMDLERGC